MKSSRGRSVFRFIISCLVAHCTVMARSVAAQTSPPPGFALPARLAAIGGSGAALFDDPTARFANPALLAEIRQFLIGAGQSRAEGTDVTAVSLEAAVARPIGSFAIDVRQQRVRGLLDDPALANDPGLQIVQWNVGLTYARGFARNRILAGVSAARLTSRVFGTTGQGWTFGAGGAGKIGGRVALGASVLNVGPSFHWRTEDGITESAAGSPTALGALSFQSLPDGLFRLVFTGDEEVDLRRHRLAALRAGVIAGIGTFISVRSGYEVAKRGTLYTENQTSAAAGMSVRFGSVRVDITRDHIGHQLGQRTLVEVEIER